MFVLAGAAYAGGLSDAITETVPMAPMDDAVASEGGSLPSWVIPAAIVAILIGVAVSSGDDDDDSTAPA